MVRYPAAETAEKHERILSEARRPSAEGPPSEKVDVLPWAELAPVPGSKLEWSDRNRYFAIRGLLDGELDFLRGLRIARGHGQGTATFQRSLIRTR
jgi:hypothetical protein